MQYLCGFQAKKSTRGTVPFGGIQHALAYITLRFQSQNITFPQGNISHGFAVYHGAAGTTKGNRPLCWFGINKNGRATLVRYFVLFLFYELFDCVVELINHFFIALFDGVDDTMLNMVLQNHLACIVDG